MPLFKPFKAYRPEASEVKKFASLPSDFVSQNLSVSNNDSESLFVQATCPELFNKDLSQSSCLAASKEAIAKLIETGHYSQETQECFYLYGLTYNSQSHYGIVGCLATESYLDGSVKLSEHKQAENIGSRLKQIVTTGFDTEPVLATIKYNLDVDLIINDCLFLDPEFDFVTPDGVTHQVWVVSNQSKIRRLQQVFNQDITTVFIADSYMRATPSVDSKDLSKESHSGLDVPSSFMIAVFPENQLQSKAYHRIISISDIIYRDVLNLLSNDFEISKSEVPYYPQAENQIGLCIGKTWYVLKYSNSQRITDQFALFNEIVVSKILQISREEESLAIEYVRGPIDENQLLGAELSKQKLAFTLPAVGAQSLFNLSDKGHVFPYRSTWFEPILRTGLVFNSLE